MILTLLLLSLFCMTAVGFIVIKVFHMADNMSNVEILPFSFGLGSGFVALQLYVYSRVGISWDTIFLALPWIILGLFTLPKLKFSFKTLIPSRKLTFYSKVLIILIVMLILFVGIESVLRPLTSWDGWSAWLFMSKMFYLEGSLKSVIFSYIPSEYPVVVSLMSTFIYLIMGNINDRLVLLLYPTFYISLALMFFFSLKKVLTVQQALFFTFLLISTQNIIRHAGRFEAGQADIIMGFYIFACALLFFQYIRTNKIGNLVLLQLFLCITFLIKNEGVPFVLLVELLVILNVLKRKVYVHLFALLLFVATFVDWQVFKNSQNLSNAPSYLSSTFHPERLSIVIHEFAREFLNIQNWNILWPTFFVSFFIAAPFLKRNKTVLMLFTIVFFQILIYFGVFFFTSTSPREHIRVVMDRALLHIAPLAVYTISIVFSLIRLKIKNARK